MSVADILLRTFRRLPPPAILNVPFTGAATEPGPPLGATLIQAAPLAGRRLLVIGGGATINTAGTAQWFHTTVAIGNELTNAMTVAAGIYQPAGPFFLPEASALWISVTIGIFRGHVLLETV